MTMPLALGRVTTTPSTRASPASARSSPAMMFMSVDLPQPEGPTMATNSPSAIEKLTPPITGSVPLSVTKPLRMSATATLADISPPHGLQPFEQPHRAIEHQPDHADDDHPGDHQVVAVPGVARVHDHVAQARAQRDHLRRDHDQPGDTQADAHPDNDLREHSGNDDTAEERVARDAEVGRRPEIAPFDGMHARDGLHDHGEDRGQEDQENGRQVAHA